MKKRSIPIALVALVIASLVAGVVAMKGSETLTGQLMLSDQIDLELVEVTPERTSAGSQSPGNDYGRFIFTIKNVGSVPYNLLNGGRVRFKEVIPGGNGYTVVQHIRGDMILSGDAVIQPGNTTVVKMTAHTYSIPATQELSKTAIFRVLEYPNGLDSVPENNILNTTVTFPVLPAMCGNGVVENNEQCDDGNTESGDFCNHQCEQGPYENVRLMMKDNNNYIDLQNIFGSLWTIYQENLDYRLSGNPIHAAASIDINQDGYLEDFEARLINESLQSTNPAIIDPFWEFYEEIIDETLAHNVRISIDGYRNILASFHESIATGNCNAFGNDCDMNGDGKLTTEDFGIFANKIMSLIDFLVAHSQSTTSACIEN